MGLLDFGSTPEEGVKGPYTDYDAALTALRADATASDGDLYQLDNDMIFVAYTSEGPGILIPSDLYDRVSGYASNASGDSYLTTSDTKADLTGRGWTITENNEGAVTGGDGSAFRLDAGTNIGGSSDTAALGFTPTSNQTSVICLVKMQPISGTLNGQSIACGIYTGADLFRVCCTDGSNGSFSVVQSGTTNLSAAIGDITETSATWFIAYCDTTTSTNVVYFRRLESSPEESLSAETSDLPSTASDYAPYFRSFQGSVGSHTVIDIYESHAMVTT
jgi:hypothetical protein